MDYSVNIQNVVLNVLSYGLMKNFGLEFFDELVKNNVVNSNGEINIEELKFIMLKLTFTHYVQAMKFNYLVYYSNNTFKFFNINDKDVFNKLLQLKLKFPTYGTKDDRSDASIVITD
jgi:hypothetical protein